MEWGWIVIYALGIFGAAAVVGGIVAYRGNSRPGIRSLAAASVASGIVMWAIVLMVVPASVTTSGSGPPVIERNETAQETLAK